MGEYARADTSEASQELTPEAQRLHELMRLNVAACTVTTPCVLLFWFFYRTPSLLLLAGLVGLTVWIQIIGARHARANRVDQGITALSLAIWTPTLGMAVLAPEGWALTVVFSVLAVLLAVPFVSSVRLLQFIAISTGILIVGGFFRANPVFHAFPADISPFVLGVFVTAGSSLGALLCMFSVWQSNAKLVEILNQTRDTNRLLRDSERTLELRVKERTNDLVESQRELALARDEALDANRTKSAFLANMSHELRTPLNAIIGYSELLKEDADDEGHDAIVPDLDKILGAGNHLLGLINDILDLSKVEAGRMEILREEFLVATLVQEITASIQPIIARGDNTLEVGDLSQAGAMNSDATKLRQILLNLLSNAAKFTEQGTISLQVERGREADLEWVEFRVRDSGIGMTPQQLDSIFEAFAQAAETTQRDYGGTGLGLAISRRFCQLLGGSVTARSEPDQGTEFRVRLPALAPETSEVTEPTGAAGYTESEPPSRHGTSGPTVLVIDDELDARELLQTHLCRDGYRVVTTASGAEGLELARELRPDVITLDIRMPGMDGWRVLSELKANAHLAAIPVILVTILEDQNLGYALGASEFLTKPVSRDRLSQIVHRYASRSATVLVVEDDEDTRALICRAVEAEGMRPIEAENGRDALDLLAEARPALILTDLMMPEIDGFELLARLQHQKPLRDIPVVVITAKDLTQEEQNELAGRAEQVIEKGACEQERVLAEVRRHVRSALERSSEGGAID